MLCIVGIPNASGSGNSISAYSRPSCWLVGWWRLKKRHVLFLYWYTNYRFAPTVACSFPGTWSMFSINLDARNLHLLLAFWFRRAPTSTMCSVKRRERLWRCHACP